LAIEGQRGGGEGGAIRPGQLSALLEELARAPEPPAEDGWGRALQPGATIGKFELVREIGAGGFGVVWEARDRELNRSVAFKAVRAGGKAGLREERLLREAEAAARLSHPNIVTLFDLGRAEAGPYLVLELLQGQTLEERLAEGELTVSEAVRIAAEVAKGVAHAHAQGVVHRDLKPANVFLCQDGQVKVLDFGLAHAFGRRRQDGGTPAYMAPEQWEGAPEDERTDVFALGVMLFRMLSGELPFAHPEGKDHRSRQPAPALLIAEQPGLGALVGRMLAKRPVERPRDGGEVAGALTALLKKLERAPASGQPAVRTRRRPGLRLAGPLAVGIAAGALLAGGVAWWRTRGPPTPVAGVDGPIVVAVADIANETGEREMDALSGLLITSLEQSRQLSVLPRGRLFDLARQAGHPDVARIDEVMGREVGRKAGARALLLTSIHRLGKTYAVQLRALDPAKDQDLFSAKETVSSQEAIFGLLDRLAERVRSELRESQAEVSASETKPVGGLTTSLEAYEHYFRAQELGDRGDLPAAAQEYRKALAVDPRFALAHYGLSTVVMVMGAPDAERREHAEAAARWADQLPERERLLVQAWHARTFFRFEEMGRHYRALVERYPGDKRSLLAAGSGVLMGLSDAEFVQHAAEKALALDSSLVDAHDLLLHAFVTAEKLDEALVHARRWERESQAVNAGDWLATVHLLRGEPDEALRAIRAAIAAPGRTREDLGLLRLSLVRVHLRRDELEAAEAEAREVPLEVLDRYTFAFRAVLAVYRGRPREAERMLAGVTAPFEQSFLRTRLEALAAAGGPSLALRAAARAMRGQSGTIDCVVAAVLALAGEVGLAAEVARSPQGRKAQLLVDALRLRWVGDLAGARRALEGLRHAPTPFVRQVATFALGETCQAAGDDRCALEALRAFRWMGDPAWQLESRAWAYPRSLLLVARSQERLGDRQAARATVDHLLGMWKHAEPDFAPLAEARALRARLAKVPPAPPKGASEPSRK